MRFEVLRQMVIWLGSVAMVMVTGVVGGLTRADDLDQFRAEYPKAEAGLEEAYSHLTIVATETVNDGTGKFGVMANCECLREGDLVRGKQTVIRSAISIRPLGAIMASGGSGDRTFIIFKENPASAFRFLFFGTLKNKGTYNRLTYTPLFCPYNLLTSGVADFIRQKNVTLVSAAPIKWTGQDAIEVIANLTDPDHAPFTFAYHFVFQPRTWALVGWIYPLTRITPPASWRAQITYEPESDPPRVRSLDKWLEGPDPKVKHDGEHWEINELKFGSIDPKEFEISAFGVKPPSDGAVTAPATAPPGKATQPSPQGSSGASGDTIGSVDLPVPLDANHPATSTLRLGAYGVGSVGLGLVGAYFGIRAARLGSSQRSVRHGG